MKGRMISTRVLRATALASLLTLLLGSGASPFLTAASASSEDSVEIGVTIPPKGDLQLSNAQLRWGINVESNSGAFFGGCNFLMAGQAGDAGSSRVWTANDGLYQVADGNVRVEKPDGSGGWTAPSWSTKCLDHTGRAVTTNPAEIGTGTQVVIEEGTGNFDAAANELSVEWEGTFSVVYYGGMTYWWASDPVLELKNGNGTLTATLSGYGADMHDASKWVPLGEHQVTLATLTGVSVNDEGFVHLPDYAGVEVDIDADGPSVEQDRSASGWGAFPADFVEFHSLTGQQGYWYTSGGIRDPAKTAEPLYISFDAESAVDVDGPPRVPEQLTPGPGGGSGQGPGSDAGQGSGVTAPTGSGLADPGTGGFPDYPLYSAASPYEPLDLSGLLDQAALEPAAAVDADGMELTRFGTPIVPQEIDWIGAGLIPDGVAQFVVRHKEAFLWGLAAVMALGAVSVLAFRRGWLVLPWKTPSGGLS